MAARKRRGPLTKWEKFQAEQTKEVYREVADAIRNYAPVDFSKPLTPNPETVLHHLLSRILQLVYLRQHNVDVGALMLNYMDVGYLDNVFVRMLGDAKTILSGFKDPPYGLQATLEACVIAWQQKDTAKLRVVMCIVEAHVQSLRNDTLPGATKPTEVVTAPAGQVNPAVAPKPLIGKAEILDALGLKDEKWRFVLRLSKKQDGPIRTRKGGKSIADRDALHSWWTSVVEKYGALKAAEESRRAELETKDSSYSHGRSNQKVVPPISGHTLEPRKPR